MTKQEFEGKLESLLREFEKENEPVELEFAYFDDDLDMVHLWDDKGFIFQKHPYLLENERNTESELPSGFKNLIFIEEENINDMEKVLYNPIRASSEFPLHYEVLDYHEFSFLKDFLNHVFNRDDIDFKETIFNEETRKYEALFYVKEQESGISKLASEIKKNLQQ